MLHHKRVPLIEVGHYEPFYHSENRNALADYNMAAYPSDMIVSVWREEDDPHTVTEDEIAFRKLAMDHGYTLRDASYLYSRRYTVPTKIHGEVSASELGMHKLRMGLWRW